MERNEEQLRRKRRKREDRPGQGSQKRTGDGGLGQRAVEGRGGREGGFREKIKEGRRGKRKKEGR